IKLIVIRNFIKEIIIQHFCPTTFSLVTCAGNETVSNEIGSTGILHFRNLQDMFTLTCKGDWTVIRSCLKIGLNKIKFAVKKQKKEIEEYK
ncbi:hypothetical protein, partial [uncultured Paenibacillus sp.]|uniref:hypothetical protein n=1 Tax=uncultured Paenibacillus sp. TaxID=227322 RepID=UPI0025986C81